MIVPIPSIDEIRVDLIIIIQISSQCPQHLLLHHLHSSNTIISPNNKSIASNPHILRVHIDNTLYLLVSDIDKLIEPCTLYAPILLILFLYVEF